MLAALLVTPVHHKQTLAAPGAAFRHIAQRGLPRRLGARAFSDFQQSRWSRQLLRFLTGWRWYRLT